MTKSKNKSNRPKGPNTTVVRKAMVVRPRQMRNQVEPDALSYKRVLLDPCNAELCKTPYGGNAGSTIIREHIVFNNTYNAVLCLFHPVLGVFISGNPAVAGGVGPLNGTAQITGATRRAIAGCLEVMYTGAESARAGTVYCGIVPGAIAWNYLPSSVGGAGSTFDMSHLASVFTNVTRTPVDRCSVNWFPSSGDADWIPPMTINLDQIGAIEKIFSATQFAAILISGTEVNDMRFSATKVVEFSGISSSAGTNAQIPWTIQASSTKPIEVGTVLRSLAAQDPKWYLDTFRKVAHFGVGLASSVMRGGLPGALGYLTAELGSSTDLGGRNQRYVRAAT